jgi:hypothetical protein
VRSFFDPAHRAELIRRLRSLRPDAARRWGKMTAPQMIVHLTDQMTHALGDVRPAPEPGPLRNALVRRAAIYWVPWPKGRVKGPAAAFVTAPGEWDRDVARLEGLIERFAVCDQEGDWPEHILLGPMRGRDWGAFCYKHFDHHLRQFGA